MSAPTCGYVVEVRQQGSNYKQVVKVFRETYTNNNNNKKVQKIRETRQDGDTMITGKKGRNDQEMTLV